MPLPPYEELWDGLTAKQQDAYTIVDGANHLAKAALPSVKPVSVGGDRFIKSDDVRLPEQGIIFLSGHVLRAEAPRLAEATKQARAADSPPAWYLYLDDSLLSEDLPLIYVAISDSVNRVIPIALLFCNQIAVKDHIATLFAKIKYILPEVPALCCHLGTLPVIKKTFLETYDNASIVLTAGSAFAAVKDKYKLDVYDQRVRAVRAHILSHHNYFPTSADLLPNEPAMRAFIDGQVDLHGATKFDGFAKFTFKTQQRFVQHLAQLAESCHFAAVLRFSFLGCKTPTQLDGFDNMYAAWKADSITGAMLYVDTKGIERRGWTVTFGHNDTIHTVTRVPESDTDQVMASCNCVARHDCPAVKAVLLKFGGSLASDSFRSGNYNKAIYEGRYAIAWERRQYGIVRPPVEPRQNARLERIVLDTEHPFPLVIAADATFGDAHAPRPIIQPDVQIKRMGRPEHVRADCAPPLFWSHSIMETALLCILQSNDLDWVARSPKFNDTAAGSGVDAAGATGTIQKSPAGLLWQQFIQHRDFLGQTPTRAATARNQTQQSPADHYRAFRRRFAPFVEDVSKHVRASAFAKRSGTFQKNGVSHDIIAIHEVICQGWLADLGVADAFECVRFRYMCKGTPDHLGYQSYHYFGVPLHDNPIWKSIGGVKSGHDFGRCKEEHTGKHKTRSTFPLPVQYGPMIVLANDVHAPRIDIHSHDDMGQTERTRPKLPHEAEDVNRNYHLLCSVWQLYDVEENKWVPTGAVVAEGVCNFMIATEAHIKRVVLPPRYQFVLAAQFWRNRVTFWSSLYHTFSHLDEGEWAKLAWAQAKEETWPANEAT